MIKATYAENEQTGLMDIRRERRYVELRIIREELMTDFMCLQDVRDRLYVYITNRMGPRTEPWGTACGTDAASDRVLLTEMICQRLEMYD